MSYFNKQQEFEEFLKTRFEVKDPDEIIFGIDDIGNKYELTLNEIGELYEETQKIMAGEMKTGELFADLSSKITSTERMNVLTDDMEQFIKRIQTPGGMEVPTATEGAAGVSSGASGVVAPEKISGLAEKFDLGPGQAEKLTQITNDILSGKRPVSSYRVSLVDELRISYNQALKIAFDVNSMIFAPVMEKLRQMEERIKAGGEGAAGTGGAEKESARTQPEKNEVLEKQMRSAPDQEPEHMIVDHEVMVSETGPHLHSQTVMPQKRQVEKPRFGTTIDEKLSKIVRGQAGQSSATPPENLPKREDIEKIRSEKYGGADPYREPIS